MKIAFLLTMLIFDERTVWNNSKLTFRIFFPKFFEKPINKYFRLYSCIFYLRKCLTKIARKSNEKLLLLSNSLFLPVFVFLLLLFIAAFLHDRLRLWNLKIEKNDISIDKTEIEQKGLQEDTMAWRSTLSHIHFYFYFHFNLIYNNSCHCVIKISENYLLATAKIREHIILCGECSGFRECRTSSAWIDCTDAGPWWCTNYNLNFPTKYWF